MSPKISDITRRLIITGVFAIGMGFLEAIVVVYLRDLYYPEGFDFPLVSFDERLLVIEWIREFATLIMLVTVGMLAGRTPLQKFGMFLYAFGVWDIIYYVALKLFLGWPAGLLTWDLLFLIPVTWVGPVLAPVICSLTMILFVVITNYPVSRSAEIKLKTGEWIFLISGAFVIFLSFIKDYSLLLIRGGFLSDITNLAENQEFQEIITHYVPTRFSWNLFILGEILILVCIGSIEYRKQRKEQITILK
jgi:hypothetical protein